jgi:hypothetical protein
MGINFPVDAAVLCGTGLDNLTAISVSAWIKIDGHAASSYVVGKSLIGAIRWALYVDGATGSVSFGIGRVTTATTAIGSTHLTDGTWYHVACNWDGTLAHASAHLYLGGAEEAHGGSSADGSGSRLDDSYDTLLLGNRFTSMDRDFDGEMTEVAIWGGGSADILTPGDIANLCFSRLKGMPLMVKPSLLLDERPALGAVGNGQVFDRVGTNHGATVAGSPVWAGETILSYPPSIQ